MASRVYDELYAEYGRMPSEGEVRLRLERRIGWDRATASAEDATSPMVAAAESLAPPGETPRKATEGGGTARAGAGSTIEVTNASYQSLFGLY